MNNTYITLQLPEELDEKARIRAATMKISRSKLIRIALEKFLREKHNEDSGQSTRERSREENNQGG